MYCTNGGGVVMLNQALGRASLLLVVVLAYGDVECGHRANPREIIDDARTIFISRAVFRA